jgi:DNA (cytosine-5)-methyltransferase 1
MLTSRGLGYVLGDLAEMGFDARWGVFSACSIGAPHARERMFLVAHTTCSRYKNRLSFGEKKEHPPHGDRVQNTFEHPIPKRPPLESLLVREADGMANRVDRLKALGNGQVPAVAAIAWTILS